MHWFIQIIIKIFSKILLKHANTAQKMKFSIKNFFNKCDQIGSFHLLEKSLIENFWCRKFFVQCNFFICKCCLMLLLMLDTQMKICDNFLIDINSGMAESAMGNFSGTYHLHSLIKDPTCFKNPDKPSCIDLLLTNFTKSFLKSQTLETGLSDFYKLTLTVLKRHYKKQKSLVVTYRDCKNFSY